MTQEATGTFDLGGFGTSIGSLAGSGAVILGAAPLTTGGDNGSSTFAGAISGDGRVMGFCSDVTERKQAQRALSDSESRFRRISSLTSDLVYSCRRGDDGRFQIEWAGGQADKLFGHSTEDQP